MRLLALDGNSILNRAFYGIKILTTKNGTYTNGVYGFMNILFKLMEDLQPEAVAVAFDMHAPTFRHKEYAEYKAGRKGMPDELASQLPVLKQLLTAFGYHVLETEGFEADDILGTLARACDEQGHECFIATGDRDTLQLVCEHVTVYLAATKMGSPHVTVYDAQQIQQEYFTTPEKLIDIKALMGDSSDNIPGVAGIGKKTAIDLVSRFGGIDEIYEKIDTLEIKEGVRTKLKNGKESAYLSHKLGTIATDAPVRLEVTDYKIMARDDSALIRILSRLEFYKMIEKLKLNPAAPAATAENEQTEQTVTLDMQPNLNALLKAGKNGLDLVTVFEQDTLGSVVVAQEGVLSKVSGPPLLEGWLRELFAAGVPIRTQDAKALFKYAILNGMETPNVKFDALLAGYLLNPSANNYSLERLVTEFGLPNVTVQGAPESEAAFFAHAAVFGKLCDRMESSIEKNRQEKLLHEMEIPLARVLADMEVTGFLVDKQGIEAYGIQLGAQIGVLENEIYQLTGYEFNLNSPKQLAEALFEKLGLPARKKTKSGYSTNAEVLESLRYEHPAVEKLLEYRQLAKLKSTYCDGLLKVVGPDGRIHSTLNQTETRTGRISSTEPNLQNIPVKHEVGRELRRFFITGEGNLLCDADYSQIELRVLAHIANDAAMIKAFNEEEDIHTKTASEVFSLPKELVTPLMRSRAKAVNFGIVYGIGAFSLSKDIGVTRKEADQYIKGYFKTYPQVAEYMERVVKQAKEQGYVDTLFGRRRYLPELNSSNANLRAFGERVARNMPIQGAAADIIKIAMIKVYNRLKSEGLNAKLILQVHDELLVEAPEKEAARVRTVLKEEMEGAAEMAVTLSADVQSGRTWYDAKG